LQAFQKRDLKQNFSSGKQKYEKVKRFVKVRWTTMM